MPTLNKELFLQLAKKEGINSKKQMAKETNISRQHLYRILDGENVGLKTIINIANRFPDHSDELFFLDNCNIKNTILDMQN